MSSKLVRLGTCLTGLMFIIIVIGSYVIVAQTSLTGDWRANTREDKDGKIQITFERKTEKGSNQHGTSYTYDQLQGLTREQTQNGPVRFSLVREAGRIDCEGFFTNGKGSGTFTFTPDQRFISGMMSRGYELSAEKQFASTTLDLTLGFIDDLRSVGFNNLDVDDLFKARIFNITPQFMAEMQATGYPNLGMEELVKARIFKIDANYVREVSQMGFAGQDFEELVKFRIFKVTPDFLSELRNEGFTSLKAEEVVKFRIFKIDADFIRRARAENPNVTVEELVRMKIGVHRTRDID